MMLVASMDFFADARLALRSALIDWRETNACRFIHGGSDDWPAWYVDRLGDYLLSQSDRRLNDAQQKRLADLLKTFSLRGACHKVRDSRKTSLAVGAHQVLGDAAPEEIVVSENGVRFALSFSAGGSVGLFLDQRDNRRRFLTGHVAAGFPMRWEDEPNPSLTPPSSGGAHPVTTTRNLLLPRPARNERGEGHPVEWASSPQPSPPVGEEREPISSGRLVVVTRSAQSGPSPLAGMELLNTFAYTCGFSVCAAIAGARTTSLDLSRKYLEWGKRNFALNGLNASDHAFIAGDVFAWLRRLARKQRQFDLIALDPPTFSQSKEHGVFQAEKDFGELVTASLPLLRPRGVVFVSTNAARLTPEAFLQQITTAIGATRRKILRQHYAPQPPDFPITRGEPAYLKTLWLRVA